MPRRNRRPRWVLVMIAVAGLFVGTAATAQATESHASTPPIVFPGVDIPTLPSVSARPSTSASGGASAASAATVYPELTLADFGLAPASRPPAQRPSANPPSSPPGGGSRDQSPAPAPTATAAAPSVAVDAGEGADPAPRARAAGRRQAPRGGQEVALPSADWRFSDGRALVAPPMGSTTDTAPVWWAVLVGLAGGIGLTATAALVVNRLDRGRAG